MPLTLTYTFNKSNTHSFRTLHSFNYSFIQNDSGFSPHDSTAPITPRSPATPLIDEVVSHDPLGQASHTDPDGPKHRQASNTDTDGQRQVPLDQEDPVLRRIEVSLAQNNGTMGTNLHSLQRAADELKVITLIYP